MATISIDRKKYRASKASATFLDKFFEAQFKEQSEVTRTIKDKEVKTKVFNIVPWKLFELAKQNGFNFDGIEKQVAANQVGALGRARMILAGAMKRKIAKGEDIKDVNGAVVEKTDEYKSYAASLAAPTVAAAAQAAGDNGGDNGGDGVDEDHAAESEAEAA